jgi:hypothetical protein
MKAHRFAAHGCAATINPVRFADGYVMDEELAIQTSKSYYMIMDEVYFLVEECTEGGYTARALGFPIFTQAETLEAIRDHIKDAVDCHFESDKPKVLRLHIVHDEILAYA